MIIDLTHTITPDTFVYPGTPRPAFSHTRTLTQNGARETLLQIGSHTGTHMDAPRHMLPHGTALDALRPLNVGQAGRISGVSPADVAALMIWLQAHDKEDRDNG